VKRRDLRWLRTSGLAALTQTEVSEVLGVDRRTVSRAIADGQLPYIRVGRRVLVPAAPLLAQLEGKTSPASQDAAHVE
jgi:excisionase family DNA binding protein